MSDAYAGKGFEEKPRPKKKGAPIPMDAEELQSIVGGVLADCVAYVDEEIGPARAEATRYYHAEKLGNEEEGRSKVVLSTVRDAVIGVLPDIMRVFFGPDGVGEFAPRHPGQEEQARQATDVVRYIFEEQNNGFLETYAVAKDALVRRLGIFKRWVEPATRKPFTLENVSHEQLLALKASDPSIEFTRIVGDEGGPYVTVEGTQVDKEPVIRVRAVPPEEILFTRETRGKEQGLCFAHRTTKKRGELIAMGISESDLDELGDGGDDTSLRLSVEEIARREAIDAQAGNDPEAGEANDDILYTEAYITVDFDGDGEAELRKVCTLGPTFKIAHDRDGKPLNTPVDDIPFEFFTPDPEPHQLVGQSWADRTKDLQLIGSMVLRAALDSLSLALFPRMGYVDGQVSVADLLNTEVGAPVRMQNPNAVQPFNVPFVGKDAFPVLEYLDEVGESRTGRNKGAIGLDADSLQSTNVKGVAAAVTAAQAASEMLVRILAEMTVKPLFRGILKMFCEHQPRARTMRLRGQWVEVDPRAWDAGMDFTVNVALGAGLTEEKIATLGMIAAKQEQIFSTMGMNQPLVTLSQYRNTLAKMAELKGFKDTTAFFNVVPPNWQPPQPAAPPPSPEQVIAQAQLQIEQMKTQRELAIKEAELQLKRQQQAAENELALRKQADDFVLRLYQIDAQFKASFSEQQLEADAEQQRQWLAGQQAAHQAAMQQRQQAHAEAVSAHERALAEQQQAHDQSIAEQQLAQQAQQAQAENGATDE